MKTISLWQPWATLIVKGIKKVETRHWETNIRGQIAIHAAKRKPDIYFPELEEADIPLGAIVGLAEIVDCLPMEKLYGSIYDTIAERSYGDWTLGRYGGIMSNPVLFDKPVNINGRQGFWDWEKI